MRHSSLLLATVALVAVGCSDSDAQLREDVRAEIVEADAARSKQITHRVAMSEQELVTTRGALAEYEALIGNGLVQVARETTLPGEHADTVRSYDRRIAELESGIAKLKAELAELQATPIEDRVTERVERIRRAARIREAAGDRN